MIRRAVLAVVAATVIAFVLLWVLTIPEVVPASALPPHTPDLGNGRTMFDIGGCASCHATPNADAGKGRRTRLGGGLALQSPFGTFYVPNISPDDADGIGRWSEADFVTALWKGTSPRGKHLFPAFPYTSYQHMELGRRARSLCLSENACRRSPAGCAVTIWRFLSTSAAWSGIWKLLFLHGGPFTPDPAQSAQLNRGAYLVNGPGHCAECHSPRNFLGAIIDSERFAGGPARGRQGLGAQHHARGIAAFRRR